MRNSFKKLMLRKMTKNNKFITIDSFQIHILIANIEIHLQVYSIFCEFHQSYYFELKKDCYNNNLIEFQISKSSDFGKEIQREK